MAQDLLRSPIFLHRPALLVACAMGSGIVLAEKFSILRTMQGPSLWLLAATLLLLVVAAILWRNALLRVGCIGIASFLLGLVVTESLTASYRDTPISHIAQMKPQKAMLVGWVESVRDAKTVREMILLTDSLGLAGERAIPARGRVLVRVGSREQLTSDSVRITMPTVGAHVRLFAAISPFAPPTNPHEFATELKAQADARTEAQADVRSLYDVYVLSKPAPDVISSLSEQIDDVHASVSRTLDDAISDTSTRGFVKAVVLGDRSDMPTETLNDFSVSGVAHILAVSGFNVAIIALVGAQLLRLLGVYHDRTRTGIGMVLVVAYAAIVGFQPSVVRAMIMIEVYCLARLTERKPDPLNIVAAAAALELLLRPTDLFDAGFELSYSAVFGLVLVAPAIKRLLPATNGIESPWLRSAASRLHDTITLSLAATLASFPVIATQFYRVSLVGLLANVPVIPFSTIITALGFLLIPLDLLYAPLARIYGEAITYATRALFAITDLSAHVPGASHNVAPPSVFASVLFIALLVYLLRAHRGKQFTARAAIASLLFAVVVLARLPLSTRVLAQEGVDHTQNRLPLSVLFFDVGQGDCILFRTPSGKNYFIDFGTVSRSNVARAERAVIPCLRAEGMTDIAAGFISHMHRDHYGGALAVASACDVSQFFSSGERIRDPLARQLDSISHVRHIVRSTLTRGDLLHIDSDLTLYVLHPDRHRMNESANSHSLAFKLVYRHASFLFLGDVERSEEVALREDYGGFLHSTVVKVAHHGSLTSSTREFVHAVHPASAIISVGDRNSYGHPAPAIVKRWSNEGASVSRTDRDGAILLESDGENVWQRDWR